MSKKKLSPDANVMPLEIKLSADIKTLAKSMTREEVKAIVDTYYRMQKIRVGSGNTIGAMERRAAEEEKAKPPTNMLAWIHDAGITMEEKIVSVLTIWLKDMPIAQWLQSHVGIGPVLAAGLIAHIDITHPLTAECIWAFAGIRPGIVWKKGMKRPFNARLKTLCWKVSSSFKIQSWRDNCFYGKLYQKRKQYEIERNEAGGQKERAKQLLETSPVKNKEVRAVWETGKLTDGHLDAMAMRWTVKLFLSHMYEVWRTLEGLPIVKPFAFSQLKHNEASYIPPPNFPLVA